MRRTRGSSEGNGDGNRMDQTMFEGTLVLEKLATIGEVEAFFEAVDSDDFDRARSLMQRAHVDKESISLVLMKMRDAGGEH